MKWRCGLSNVSGSGSVKAEQALASIMKAG